MPAPVLQIRELVKRYPGLTALNEVDLEIQEGEIFALLGPNGAGKSTLIGVVCGLVKKTSGKVHLFGVDLDVDPLNPRFQVGLVPQEINFDPFFTVSESLEYQLGFYGKPKDPERVREVLEALNLQAKANVRTRALSGGMRRRLLIAKALVHKPRLVFLDEPTAGVDVELRRDLWTYIRKLQSQGTTIILTTHYLEEAEELADRVGVINEGRLLLVEGKQTLMKRLGEKRLEVGFGEKVQLLPPPVVAVNATLSADGLRLSYVEREGLPSSSTVLRALYDAALPVVEVETRRSRLEDVMLQVLHVGSGGKR